MTIKLLQIHEKTVLILVIISYHCLKTHYIDDVKKIAIHLNAVVCHYCHSINNGRDWC